MQARLHILTALARAVDVVLAVRVVVAVTLAVVINHFPPYHPLHGALAGAACWLGFAAATSYATAVFSMQPKGLWLINSGYNLVSFMIAGAILGAWR